MVEGVVSSWYGTKQSTCGNSSPFINIYLVEGLREGVGDPGAEERRGAGVPVDAARKGVEPHGGLDANARHLFECLGVWVCGVGMGVSRVSLPF